MKSDDTTRRIEPAEDRDDNIHVEHEVETEAAEVHEPQPTGWAAQLRQIMQRSTQGEAKTNSVTRRRAEQSFSKEKLPVFDRIPSRKIGLVRLLLKFASRDQSVAIATESLGKQRFHGKVVVLVNEHSASSCEMVAAFASENKLATIVGTKTPGRLLGGHSFRVGNGYRIALPVAAYYTWNGTFLEGRGVTPDVEEPFSVTAIRNGRDAQLQRALDVANEL